jgi:hypothetical protein
MRILSGIPTYAAGNINGDMNWAACLEPNPESVIEVSKDEMALMKWGIFAICTAVILQGSTKPHVIALQPEATDWMIWDKPLHAAGARATSAGQHR